MRTVLILLATHVAASCTTPESSDPSLLRPAGIEFPHMVSPACPGEGCSYGEWMACDSVRVYGATDPSAGVIEWLTTDEPFVVETGTVIVRRPGAILVKRRTPQHTVGEAGYYFEPGDTVFVLNYLGEGFFDVSHRGQTLEAEVFWPWDSWHPAEDHEYTGEVLQDVQTEFWVSANTDDVTGWVWVDSARVAMANSLDPWPLECR